MDTRFWGPSGWKLLHLITFDYEPTPENRRVYAQFFETLPYILPCKFCRASLTDYYRIHPFQTRGRIRPGLDMRKWMYEIHNCVNDKLRKQGLNPYKDPSYASVKAFYEKWRTCEPNQQLSTFWDFLFAVAYNHPKESAPHSKPMPNCPPQVYQCHDSCEKNKWNVLGSKERLQWFYRFWTLLPAVLPLEIQQKWREMENRNPPTLECRRSALAWLWRMRCGLDEGFTDPYASVCQRIATYSSECGKKKRAITCRRRTAPTKTVKKRK